MLWTLNITAITDSIITKICSTLYTAILLQMLAKRKDMATELISPPIDNRIITPLFILCTTVI